MKITGFVWLQRVVEKLEDKHGVSVDEVEELFGNRRSLRVRRMKRGNFRGEDVYRALGRSEAGRQLVVFFIRKTTGEALVLSARDMDAKERRAYES